MRRFAKVLSGQVGRGSFVVLCPAASCSAVQKLGGASLKWAKAQQSCRFPAPSTLEAGSLGLRSPVRLSPDFSLRARARALFFLGRTGRPSATERKGGGEGEDPSLHCPFDTRTMLSKKTARMGDKAKPSGVGAPTALLSGAEMEFSVVHHRQGPRRA